MRSIIYTTDKGFIYTTFISILSLRKSLNLPTKVFVISTYNKGSVKFLFESLTKEEFTVEFVDYKVDLPSLNFRHIPPSAFMWMYYLRESQLDECIYIDGDIILGDAINDLMKLELNEKPIAAVSEPYVKLQEKLGMNSNSPYLNSGLMLISNRLLKKLDFYQRAELIIKEEIQKITYGDQCVLNKVIDGDFIKLDERFNYRSANYKHEHYCLGLQKSQIVYSRNMKSNIHYTGSNKPWFWFTNHPLKSIFKTYEKDVSIIERIKLSKYSSKFFYYSFRRLLIRIGNVAKNF